MSKKLVIIESPGKIKTYQKVLGSDYEVVSSVGHCVDLPPDKLAVDIKKDFEPTFAINKDKNDIVKNIRTKAKNASIIYLAMDPDREGSGISFHIYNLIKDYTKAKIYRVTTTEITKTGITKAIENAGDIDMKMVDSYLCRRILDRICGYKTSFLTKQSTGGRSAGRVQSAILRIIVDKEKEILHFVPEEYWVLTAHFLTQKNEEYFGILDEKIKVPNEAEATKIYNTVIKGSPIVTDVESKIVESKPYAPFTTMTLIQSASSYLGWPAKKIMKVAQTLYENGHCSYHRTDSPFMAEEAVDAIRLLVDHKYGNKYLSSTVVKYAAKAGAQEGHECCRPTHFENMTPASGDEQKLYEMIWKRAVASQMSAASDQKIKVVTTTGGFDFISRGSICLFDGFRKCWDYASKDDINLPNLVKGDKVSLSSLAKDQKFTQPPSRYSDASLSKKCENEQITRPSTFATSIATLLDRTYITQVKKSFQATELGIKVVDFLVSADMCFIDTKFTAAMEDKLDQVASDKLQKLDLLTEFWTRLKADIAKGQKIKEQQELTDHDCPKCHGKLKLKHSKFGAFMACSNYGDKEKKCDYKAQVDSQTGQPKEKIAKNIGKDKCPKCHSDMFIRTSKFGQFQGCSKFPNCNGMRKLDGEEIKPKESKKKYNKNWKKKG